MLLLRQIKSANRCSSSTYKNHRVKVGVRTCDVSHDTSPARLLTESTRTDSSSTSLRQKKQSNVNSTRRKLLVFLISLIVVYFFLVSVSQSALVCYSFGKRTGGSARRPNECFVLEPSEMIVVSTLQVPFFKYHPWTLLPDPSLDWRWTLQRFLASVRFPTRNPLYSSHGCVQSSFEMLLLYEIFPYKF